MDAGGVIRGSRNQARLSGMAEAQFFAGRLIRALPPLTGASSPNMTTFAR
ncbi:MAG: hypothetical protein IANPNBLG_02053 [Bryobacteraceae bacterium]|nr:hypothetical protein [Bryobacteraceae bacterium]